MFVFLKLGILINNNKPNANSVVIMMSLLLSGGIRLCSVPVAGKMDVISLWISMNSSFDTIHPPLSGSLDDRGATDAANLLVCVL